MTAQDARIPRSQEEEARLSAFLHELFEKMISFNQFLGLKVDSVDPAAPRLRLEMKPQLVGHFLQGRLHGGVISAALDTVGGLALMTAIADKHRDETLEQIGLRCSKLGTIDLRVDYLRPGIGKQFVASARVTRLGNRIGSTQMTLENEGGALIATGSAAYVVG